MPTVQIVEVGPRDGFQSVLPFIPTDRKIAIIRALHAAGIRRVEATAFVSPSAVPQMADAQSVLAGIADLPGSDPQVLVPTARHGERAIAAGARHFVFVLSVSESHNRSNVRRSPLESCEEYERFIALLPAGARVRLNLATAFDCPYEGRTDIGQALKLLQRLLAAYPHAEVGLCDTTGRADPGHVETLVQRARDAFPDSKAWAFHGHDTYGLGAANVLAAYKAGITVFDASVAGLGGCPFAPGATGNVATEDLVWMFERMGVETGIDLRALVAVARDVVALPGAQTGGRVRDALAAAECRQKEAIA